LLRPDGSEKKTSGDCDGSDRDQSHVATIADRCGGGCSIMSSCPFTNRDAPSSSTDRADRTRGCPHDSRRSPLRHVRSLRVTARTRRWMRGCRPPQPTQPSAHKRLEFAHVRPGT